MKFILVGILLGFVLEYFGVSTFGCFIIGFFVFGIWGLLDGITVARETFYDTKAPFDDY